MKGFLTGIKLKGFKSRRPNILISKLYNIVLGKYFIFLYNSCPVSLKV